MMVMNGPVLTVSYSVEGGSPQLQALCQGLQFTETEMTVTRELQKLRLGIVANEQTLDMVRTSQALGLGPISTPAYAHRYGPSESALKCALIPGLAQEATPAAAFQLINLWQQLQTQLQTEQSKAASVVRTNPQGNQNVLPTAPATQPTAFLQLPVQQLATPPDQAALERTVRQFQATMNQQIRQMQQQIR
jgi:hypothetical protein